MSMNDLAADTYDVPNMDTIKFPIIPNRSELGTVSKPNWTTIAHTCTVCSMILSILCKSIIYVIIRIRILSLLFLICMVYDIGCSKVHYKFVVQHHTYPIYTSHFKGAVAIYAVQQV